MERKQGKARGFAPLAARIVRANPGMTAQEVCQKALAQAERDGRSISVSKSPLESLVATLHKMDGRRGIEKRMDRYGVFRFYPESAPEERESHRLDLSPEEQRQVDELTVMLGTGSEDATRQLIFRTGLEQLARTILQE